MSDVSDEPVVMIGNRAAISAEVLIGTIGADSELGRWITTNCEHSINMDAWLLPVYDEVAA